MKKLFTIFFLMFLITFHLSAAERGWPDIRMALPLLDVKWSPVQISVWPVSLVPAENDVDIYGLNLNLTTLFHGQNNVYGLSCGLFHFFDNKYGAAVSLLNGGSSLYGFSLGAANIFLENNGVCTGIINDAVNRNTSISGDGKTHRRKTANILQIGYFNKAHEGFQFGVFNVIEKADEQGFSFQLGLLNHNPDGLLPWMPLFLLSLPSKEYGQ